MKYYDMTAQQAAKEILNYVAGFAGNASGTFEFDDIKLNIRTSDSSDVGYVDDATCAWCDAGFGRSVWMIDIEADIDCADVKKENEAYDLWELSKRDLENAMERIIKEWKWDDAKIGDII